MVILMFVRYILCYCFLQCFSYIVVFTTLQNLFSLTFQDKMNRFPWLIVHTKYQRWLSIACNHARNKGGGTNLKVEIQIICKRSECSLRTTVENFFCIFVNFCTLVLLSSLIFSDRRNYVIFVVSCMQDCNIEHVAGGGQYGRSSKPVLSHSSTAAASAGSDSGTGCDGPRLTDAVLSSYALQADAHHLLPRRCEWGAVCNGLGSWTARHSWSLHETGDWISAGDNIRRCAEETPHATVLCRQAWPGTMLASIAWKQQHTGIGARFCISSSFLQIYSRSFFVHFFKMSTSTTLFLLTKLFDIQL